MHVPDWLQQAVLWLLGTLATGAITTFVWIVRLGYRVSTLEAAAKRAEEAQREAADAMQSVRHEAQGLIRDLHNAREQALLTFVTKADLSEILDEVKRRRRPPAGR